MATIGEKLDDDLIKRTYHDLNDAENVEGISRAGGSEPRAAPLSPRGSVAVAISLSLKRRARAAEARSI